MGNSSLNILNDLLDSWPKILQVRDLSVISLEGGQSLVIACDSGGAIGSKELDEIKVSNYILGRFITRVALLEVVAAGALPVLVCDTLTVEMKPSGEEILSGVKAELDQLGLGNKIQLTGTTEENFRTRQSGIGITVIGLAKTGSLRLNKAQVGDEILCFGYPKVGGEVELDDPEIITVQTILQLLAYQGVREIVPVGSKGILYEAGILAENSNLKLELDSQCNLPLKKSGGPATCVVAAVDPYITAELKQNFSLPIARVGWV
jgi:hypothetical protein